MIHYSINNTVFSNGIDAFDHAARYCPHDTVKFNFDDQFWLSQNWATEPAETFSFLLDYRARQVREKYGYLIFYFSGGTDSYLMWEVFRRNQIRIDEIVVVVSNTGTVFDATGPADTVTWLYQNHYDPTTKITVIPKICEKLSDMFYNHASTLKKTYSNQPLPTASNSMWIYEQLLNQHSHQNPGIVIGAEKPLLVFEGGAWFVSHLDKSYRLHIPKLDQVEWFYVSRALPELHIKQCHMLLKQAKQQKPLNATRWTTAEWSGRDYYGHARACGRPGELFMGSSQVSKISTVSWQQGLSDQHTDISKLISDLMPDIVTEFVNRSLSFDIRLYMERQGLYNGSDSDWHGIYSTMIKVADHV